jgi:leucine-rich repeat-containing protein 49
MKVLLMPRNQISKIQNIDHLSQLEVLDLHSNKITSMEGVGRLKHLRILNLYLLLTNY